MRLSFRIIFALIVSAFLFVALAWFFGVFLNPVGSNGAGFAIGLIFFSALAALYVFNWLARPGPKANFRNRGVDGVDKGWGAGMMGASQHSAGRRRRDDDADDYGGRRSASDLDDDGMGFGGAA